jgi:hypothetical protein
MEEMKSVGGYHPPVFLLDEKKAALFLQVSPKTLQSWRFKGSGPIFRKIGSLVRYLERDLISYVEGQARHSTSEVATDG